MVLVRNRFVRFFLALSFCMILALAGYYRYTHRMPDFPERYAAHILYPFIRMQAIITRPLRNFFSHRASYKELEDRYSLLQTQYEQLLQEHIALQSCQQIWQEIEEMTVYRERYQTAQAQLAQVITPLIHDHSHALLVDKGSRHGIEVDMIAVYKNCLIGRVTHVFPGYSRIILITDAECRVAGTCSSSQATGILTGINRLEELQFTHVPHLQALQVGDLILSNGSGLIFPRGFGLGKIKSFVKDGLFYQVTVQSLIDLSKIQYCYLVTK